MESELKVNLQDYKIIGTLGIGSFGQVFLVENVNTHQKYSAKVSYKEFTNEVDQVYFSTLMETFSKLDNPAVHKIDGYNIINFFNENRLTVLTKFMTKGSLNQVFKNEKNSFTITKRYLNLLGIAFGMQYLHSKDIIHGNLNPDNILLDEQYYPHVTDYSLSKFSRQSLVNLNSPVYIAPEILEEKEFDSKADVYSYSLIAYKIITGLEPFVEGGPYNQIQNIIKGKRPDLSVIKDKNWNKFLQKLWSKNPKDRLSFDQIIETLTDPTFYSLIKINFSVVSNYLKHYYPLKSIPDNEPEKISLNYNVFLLGNAGTGKSAFLETYKSVTANHPQTVPTCSITNSQVTIKTDIGSTILSVYDTPGHERYNRIIGQYLNISHAAVFFTDVNVHEEFKLLQNWIELVKNSQTDPILYLVATKSELQWANSKDDLDSFADENHMQLFVTTWDDKESIEKVFNKIARDLITKYPDGDEKTFDQ